MKLATAFTLAFAVLAAASTPQKPHAMVSIELEDVERELNGNELVARKQVTVCEADNFTSRPVSIGLRNKSDFVQSLASIIYRRVQRHDCTQTRGTIDDISYQYHTVGRHCDTTAQQIMIEGALKKAMNLPGRTAIWPTMCLRLKHGGTCEGFLAVGEASMFNQGVLCDGSLNFDDVSTSGGKKDARSISETPGVQNKDIKDVATFSDTWTAYDLETSDNTTTDIEARKQDEVRTAKSTYLSDLTNILVSSSVVLAFTLRIPALMKTKSDNEDCATSTGSFGRIGYKYYAIGSDCATTSQVGTIEGALYHQIKETHGNKIPETECLRFDHGGTWNGWLLYGPIDSVDLTAYCGGGLNFGECHEGGKKYDP